MWFIFWPELIWCIFIKILRFCYFCGTSYFCGASNFCVCGAASTNMDCFHLLPNAWGWRDTIIFKEEDHRYSIFKSLVSNCTHMPRISSFSYYCCRGHWSNTKKKSVTNTLMMLSIDAKIAWDILSLIKWFCFGNCVSVKKFLLTGSENFHCP